MFWIVEGDSQQQEETKQGWGDPMAVVNPFFQEPIKIYYGVHVWKGNMIEKLEEGV